MKKKDNIGCLVVFIVIVLIVSHILAFSSGKNRTIAVAEKEMMMSDKVKDLEKSVEFYIGLLHDQTIKQANEETDIQYKILDVANNISKLSDTLHLVSPSFVKKRLDDVKIDVYHINKFD